MAQHKDDASAVTGLETVSEPYDAAAEQFHDAEAVRKIVNRQKRAQGQLAAVMSGVESGSDRLDRDAAMPHRRCAVKLD
jgi:hypothetical protein